MDTGILLITHGELGRALLDAVSHVLGAVPPDTEALSVDSDRGLESLETEARACQARLNRGGGVLVLTDLAGSTPANVAAALQAPDTRVVAGVNLSMLVRVMNYRALPLDELVQKALSGGYDGIAEFGSP